MNKFKDKIAQDRAYNMPVKQELARVRNEQKQMQITSQKRMAEVKDYVMQTAGLLKRIKPDNWEPAKIYKEINDSLDILNHLTAIMGYD